MTYLSCLDVSQESIYEAFKLGFSDYLIPIEITMDAFFHRFFGKEGNSLDLSFIALDGEESIGLILGGIRELNGKRTMRCGGLCVAPDYRGKGVSQELYRHFHDTATDHHVDLILLEVITVNHPAIRFYEKLGFRIHNKILYYSREEGAYSPSNWKVKPTDIERIAEIRKRSGVYLNWQNEVDYFRMDPSVRYFEVEDKGESIGTLAVGDAGNIYFLYVEEAYRYKGVATALFTAAGEKLSFSFPDLCELEEFLKRVGFNKLSIEQYEMKMDV